MCSDKGCEGNAHQGSVGTEESGEGDAECKGERGEPAGDIEKAPSGPEDQRKTEDGESLGKRLGGVDGGEWAERGEPQGGLSGRHAAAWRTDSIGKKGEQEASGQFDDDLHAGGREVVLDAEEPEAGRKEEWIAGEANEGGVEESAAVRERVAGMEKEVPGHAAVELRVAIYFKEFMQHP